MRTIALAALCTILAISPSPVLAGCYACGGDDCCQDAAKGSFGKDICTHRVLFVGSGESCHDCFTSGSSCAGTAEPECDNALGICEQHRTLFVPNGEPTELRLLLHPPVVGWTALGGAAECDAL